MLLASLGIAAGLMLILTGLFSVQTGGEAAGLPAEIEVISPGPGDRVLRQTPITADLAVGYEGRLTIDDRAIPVERISSATAAVLKPGELPRVGSLVTVFDPGNNTLTYVPQEGGEIAQFAPGRHRVKVEYWRIELGPDTARPYTWEFEVTG